MLMRKQLMRVKKQFADQSFLRGDKPESLRDDLDIAQKRVDAIKSSCQSVQKKIAGCLQGCGIDNLALEKRRKKMPAFSLGNSMQDSSSNNSEFSVLGSVLNDSSPVQIQLAEELLTFEVEVEKTVLTPLNTFLDNDIPHLNKIKKQLSKLCQDMESAKSKYETAVRHAHQATGNSTSQALSKAEQFKEEYDELTMKVDLQRDALAGEMFALLSREPEFAHIIVQWYNLQADYHSRVAATLERAIPKLKSVITENMQQPAYGCALEDHLRVTNRQISFVLEFCICTLLEVAMEEEGLFRMAGSASKVKKLKNAFDAGILTMSDYVTDPHAIAGALKSYLRELPEPLLTFHLYDEWMTANRVTDHDARLQNLWQVLNRMPEPNYNNLRYLIKFLSKLTSNCDQNKMSPQNIAIVMAPNLMWPPNEDKTMHIGMNMTVANIHSSIVDTLVSYADWFFPGELEFNISSLPLTRTSSENIIFPVDAHQGIINSAFVGANGEAEAQDSGSNPTNSVNTSPTSHSPRVIHRPGKKPAPPLPGGPPPQVNQKRRDSSLQRGTLNKVTNRASSTERNLSGNIISEGGKTFLEDQNPETKSTGEGIRSSYSRSSTLDRPGKPKRNSISHRQSNDNLNEATTPLTKPSVPVRNSSVENANQPEKLLEINNPPAGKSSSFNAPSHTGSKSNLLQEEPKHVRQMSAGNIVDTGNLNALGNQVKHKRQLSSGTKPEIPAKPSSLDNLSNNIHVENMMRQLHISSAESSEESQKRKSSSDKDSIHFADDSDVDDCIFNSDGIQTKAPASVSDINEDKEANSSLATSTINSAQSKFDRKWDFLTGQTTSRPPERPPRAVLTTPYITTPSSVTETEEVSEETVSLSQIDLREKTDVLSVVSDDKSQSSLLAQPVVTAGVDCLDPAQFPARADNPPSPTGSSKIRPARPQPPAPPTKPKMNNNSEDTRL